MPRDVGSLHDAGRAKVDGKRQRRFPLLPMPPDDEQPRKLFSPMFTALAIAIPVSLLVGVLIAVIAVLLTLPVEVREIFLRG